MSEKDGWLGSEARFELSRLVASGRIDEDTSPEDAFEMCKSCFPVPFKHYRLEPKFWPKRLTSVITEVQDLKERAALEKKALIHDRRLKPKQSTTLRGYPRWEGSPAEALLRADIDAGEHKKIVVVNGKPKKMTPAMLMATRPEYKVHGKTFSGHIGQDIRRRKYKQLCIHESKKKFAECEKKAKSVDRKLQRKARKDEEEAQKQAAKQQLEAGKEALRTNRFRGDISTLKLKVPELKELCREKGLQVSGKKAVLEARLNDHFAMLQEQEESKTD